MKRLNSERESLFTPTIIDRLVPERYTVRTKTHEVLIQSKLGVLVGYSPIIVTDIKVNSGVSFSLQLHSSELFTHQS